MSSQIGPMLIRALTSTEDGYGDPLAQRILDATVEEAASSGLRGLSVDDVARRADTTRMTVYRRFGRREQLIEAMATRETRRFISAVSAAIAAFQDVADQGAEAFVVGLRFMHNHPFARRAIESEPEAIIALLEAENGLIFTMGRDFIAEGLHAGGAEHCRPNQVAETIARIFVSFLLLPRSVVTLDDERAARAYVRDCIAPIITSSARLDLTDGALV
jgi:AcrR family transcriptional regulator